MFVDAIKWWWWWWWSCNTHYNCRRL